MKSAVTTQGYDKIDGLVASGLGLLALAAYVRTLAPDILYGDSAEFQCLAYTFGVTHSTGYPTYLFLGRLLGFLPLNSPAWRISLLSAVCAAITVGGVYLLARDFTRSRVGAASGSLALAISYTFWSQAVIAEVYTPGMAFLTVILLLLFRWQAHPETRWASLLAAALVAGVGFGVHASVWLVAPPAVALVLWTLRAQRSAHRAAQPASRSVWLRSLSAGLIGAALGLVLYLAAFFISDRINPPTSFINTTLEPSRIFWKIQPEDFQSPWKRLEMTVVSAQWGDALFPTRDFSFAQSLGAFGSRLGKVEFTPLVLLLALLGLGVMLVNRPMRGAFYPLAFFFSALFILNYRVGDINVFYLSLYLPLAVAAGTGIGFILEFIHRRLTAVPDRGFQLVYLLPVLFFVSLVVQPFAADRWKAIQAGAASFVTDDYPYPVKNLAEPRFVAQQRLAGAAENAVFALDWRALYSTAYLAHVEQGRSGTLFFEAMPRGNDGKVASTLIARLKGYLEEGRPVYTDQNFPGLADNFRLAPAQGNLLELKLKD